MTAPLAETLPLTLSVPGFDVPAALTLPAGVVRAAMLLVPGSLFADVDGNYPTWNSFPRVYAHLAEAFAERGIATLRFAKLGPGTGSVQTDPVLGSTNRGWAGRAHIARAGLALLRSELRLREIEPPITILAGHSEGAVVVSVLAHQGGEDLSDVDGVVLLSGPSVGILEIMLEQSRATGVGPANDDQTRLLEEVIAVIRRGEPIPEEMKARASGPFGAGALVNFPPDALAYMREVDATDPIAMIREYPKPVLIIQGGADDSVPPHHGEALRDARIGSGVHGHRQDLRPTTYVLVSGVQHMYKQVPPGLPPAESFGYPGPTDPRVAQAVSDWIDTLRE